MRAWMPVVLMVIAASCARAGEPAPAAIADSDREQIRQILRTWQDAWARHDMRTFAQLFHEDATWVVWTGRVWKGRKAVEDGHVEAHATFFRNSTQTSEPEEITQIAPDVVVARSLTTLRGDSREPAGTVIFGRKLLVITRRAGVWKILYGQNTRLAPAVAATLPRTDEKSP